MQWGDFLTYLNQGEDIHTKFLGEIYDEDRFGQYLVALANAEGGNIFVGFDIKNCHLIGTKITKEWIDDFCQSFCRPALNINVQFIDRNEKNIVCVQVTAGKQKPHYYKKKCFVMESSQPWLILEGSETTDDVAVIPDDIQAQETQLESLEEKDVVVETVDSSINSKVLDDQESVSQADVEVTEDVVEPVDIQPQELSFSENEPVKDSEPEEKLAPNLEPEAASISEVSSEETVKEPDNEEQFKRDLNRITSELIDISSDMTKDYSDLNKRQREALSFVKDQESIRNKKYRELFDVSHKTAHYELVELVEKGYLQTQGAGRSTCYVST